MSPMSASLITPMAFSLIVPLTSSLIKGFFGKGVNEKQEDVFFPLLTAPLLLKGIFGKELQGMEEDMIIPILSIKIFTSARSFRQYQDSRFDSAF